MQKDYKITIGAYSLVPFLMVLGNSMLIPEFPQIKNALNITQLQVGLLITVFSLSAGLSIPFLGYLSDKAGRLKIVIPAVLLYGIGGLVCGSAALFLTNPYPVILTGRVVQGIGAAGTAPIIMALIGDTFQSAERSEVLGIIEAANGAGKVISPILGSIIGLFSWIALFFFYALLSLPIAAALFFKGKENKNQNQQNLNDYLKTMKEIFIKKGMSLLATILAGMLVLLILFGLLAFFSDLLEIKYHQQGFSKGLIIAIPILFMSITSYLIGYILQKIKKYYKLSISSGLFIIPGALIALNYSEALISYLIFFAILGIGTGLVLPAVNTLVTSAAAEQRGIITSIYGSARFLGVASGPPIFSFLEQSGKSTMYIIPAILISAGFLSSLIFIKEKGMTPATAKNPANS